MSQKTSLLVLISIIAMVLSAMALVRPLVPSALANHEADYTLVFVEDFSEECPGADFAFKLDNIDQIQGDLEEGVTYVLADANDTVEVQIQFDLSDEGEVVDYTIISADPEPTSVFVKLGTSQNGISHLTFCYDEQPSATATPTPTPSESVEATATPTPSESVEATATPTPSESVEATATPTPTATPATGSIDLTKVPECEICDTFTPGYYFNQGENNAGTAYAEASLSADPITVGGMTFDSVEDVQTWAASGSLLRHYLALALNLRQAEEAGCDLGSLVYDNDENELDGWTVQEIADAAVAVLNAGDDKDDAPQLHAAIDEINNNHGAEDGVLVCGDGGSAGLPGATFELWLDDGDLVVEPSEDTLIDEQTTDENGELSFTGLEPGTYFLIETVAPEGCEIIGDGVTVVTLTETELTASVTVENACEQPEATPTPTPSESEGEATPTPTPSESEGEATPTPTPSESEGEATPTATPSGSIGGEASGTPRESVAGGNPTPAPSGGELPNTATGPATQLPATILGLVALLSLGMLLYVRLAGAPARR